jgi:DNA-binding CsgD family transcriptional regulator
MSDFHHDLPVHVADAARELERGRTFCKERAWAEAYRSLTIADQIAPLDCRDLELLAMAATLIGRDDDYLHTLDRAHRLYVDGGDLRRAVRCAFWLALRLLLRGEMGRANGWLARGQRLLERAGRDCVEHGYLLIIVAQQQIVAGELETAYATTVRAIEIGERFAEADLIAAARYQQGRTRMQQGDVTQGLARLDETMIAVVAGELSPLMTGLIYCAVIEACQQVYALRRAREWTAALARWCDDQPELVSFTGICLVHRAEIMQLHGAWGNAIDEARRAGERCLLAGNKQATAAAFYQQAEVHRLRGEFEAAEAAYRNASQSGCEPQPGLALLRVAQGRTDAAVAAMRRVMSAVTAPLERMRFLPAHVEIMLAAGEHLDARRACDELEQMRESFDAGVLSAIVAHARGAVELAEGALHAALGSLRHAWQVWHDAEAPYMSARVRVLLGLTCRALGDHDGAELELRAARAAFEQLGAAPDVARIDALTSAPPVAAPHKLTARELQVLRMIATGKTNKAIAAGLCLSEKTVDRHVSNILTKLDVPSRAAATAHAYERKLI